MAASAAKNSPDVPPELAIGSKPLLVKFNCGEQEIVRDHVDPAKVDRTNIIPVIST